MKMQLLLGRALRASMASSLAFSVDMAVRTLPLGRFARLKRCVHDKKQN
jgi:hypothetical protein